MAANECDDKDYKEEVYELMRRVQIDIEEIEPKISDYEKSENDEIINEAYVFKINNGEVMTDNYKTIEKGT